MMRMEIAFEQRGATLFATLLRDSPKDAALMERAAHDRVWSGLAKFCGAHKIALQVPAPLAPVEPKPLLSAQP